ncbi:hypothetical protein BIW11_05996 [Tropilaelaps mercedesae]|uniref:Uncharacterized protein n=1 Tax=Tropilaelaps mercedesae TaxID=418985 RepID=A0A1V9XZZ6_9ACAR|nr:hypothetical protein BIW11_05996 [Tropilaelaps mercedesae]
MQFYRSSSYPMARRRQWLNGPQRKGIAHRIHSRSTDVICISVRLYWMSAVFRLFVTDTTTLLKSITCRR